MRLPHSAEQELECRGEEELTAEWVVRAALVQVDWFLFVVALLWFGLGFVVVVFCCFFVCFCLFLRQGLAGSPCWHQTQVPCTSVS